MMKISYKEKVIADHVLLADNFWERLVGYMFRSKPHYSGIMFKPAISIHTFFMGFSLDVIFMDREFKILRIYRNLRPWRHTWFYFKSRYTLEIPAGMLPLNLKEGDFLEVHNV